MGKQQNRRARTEAERTSFEPCAVADASPLQTLRRRSSPSPAEQRRLSIGVLAFAAGGSERSESLAFALGQEITAALGAFRCFDVIVAMSPNSTLPTCVVREHQLRRMGLDYLLDLTVSENGEGSELEVRLLDLCGNARPVWSRRLGLTDCGSHRLDEVVATQVVGCIGPVTPLMEGDMKRRTRYGTTGFLRRALPLLFSMERDKFREAGQLINVAFEIDPDDAEIAAWAARWQHLAVSMGYAPHTAPEFAKVGDLALRAMKLNPDHAQALGIYAHYCSFIEKRFDTALDYFDRSLRLNPSLAFTWEMSGMTYCYIGEPATALKCMDRYRELAPFDPYTSLFELVDTMAYLFNQDYERAALSGRRVVAAFPEFVNAYKPLVAALGHLYRREEAKPHVEALLRLEPDFTAEKFGEVYPIKKAADRKRYMEGLRLAGVAAR